MPYRHAHWYILGLIPLIGLAFWPSYWSVLPSATWQFHAHGITAFAWLMLLAAQSWTIQHGDRDTHRLAGLGSLVLFPLIGLAFYPNYFAQFRSASWEFHAHGATATAWVEGLGTLQNPVRRVAPA